MTQLAQATFRGNVGRAAHCAGRRRPAWGTLLGALLLAGAGCTSGRTIVVDTLEDADPAPSGATTLRAAVASAGPGDRITFHPSLDGGTIVLSILGERHSILKGEVYSGGPPTFQGYRDRDYGRSALYARKDLTIDASGLPGGITLRWGGDDANRARVLAVYGDLTMRNVTVTGGHSSAEPLDDPAQPFTLARGGGLAVWGTARLASCTVSGNRISGDEGASRDRGAYGGGIYANGLELEDSVVSGNRAIGYGAAGGGVYSVGGADRQGGVGMDSWLTRCTVSGNRVTAQHAYGGGIFTLSGGPDNLATMTLTNCTVARNLVEDHPLLPEAGQYYYRGGGIYMGGGSLSCVSSTIAENAVSGNAAVFSGKPNMGGGGLAATIGNAHVVEDVRVRHSIIVGNTMNGVAQDWFTGSLLFLKSGGHNLLGVLDVSQILVPVPDWMMLSRKHFPKVGDRVGVTAAQALDLPHLHASVISTGTDAGLPAVLWYPPAGLAVDQVAPASYSLDHVNAGYTGFAEPTDDFLDHVLLKLRTDHPSTLGADFGSSLGDLTGVTWHGPATTWVSNPENQAWIAAWRNIDAEIGGRLGQVVLGDDFWGSFTSGPVGGTLRLTVSRETRTYQLVATDQRGVARPAGVAGDIGAIER